MLSIQPPEVPHHYSLSYRSLSYPGPGAVLPHHNHHLPPFYANFSSMNGYDGEHSTNGGPSYHQHSSHSSHSPQSHQSHQSQEQDTSVAQALEIARESPDGARDATISAILENALSQLWSKVQAQPDSYVLTRDEFAVFNYFQHRFRDNKMATAARKRYWDNTTA